MLGSCGQGRTAGPNVGGSFEPSGSAWTGFGGIGEYRWSNGNTEAVRDAAHRVRDGEIDLAQTRPGEEVDLLVVGAGFSGLSAAYEFSKRRRGGQSILVLDNHPVPGGLAKQNELEIDGQHLVAPQGSNAALLPTPDLRGTRYEAFAQYWGELGLPESFELEPLSGAALRYRLPNDHFEPMMNERAFETGYYFAGHGWCRNPARQHFVNTPWPASVRNDLGDFINNRRDGVSHRQDPGRWLDTLTYADLLRELGYGQQVIDYIDPLIAISNFGVRSNAVSALAAQRLTLPGTIPSTDKSRFDDVALISFPGGNTPILRAMLRRLIPDSITNRTSLQTTDPGQFDHRALDRPGAPVRFGRRRRSFGSNMTENLPRPAASG